MQTDPVEIVNFSKEYEKSHRTEITTGNSKLDKNNQHKQQSLDGHQGTRSDLYQYTGSKRTTTGE